MTTQDIFEEAWQKKAQFDAKFSLRGHTCYYIVSYKIYGLLMNEYPSSALFVNPANGELKLFGYDVKRTIDNADDEILFVTKA